MIQPCLSATFQSPGPSRNWTSGFVVKDLNGQALAYMYFEKEPRRHRRELLTRDEAERIAAIFRQAPGARRASRKHRGIDMDRSSGRPT